MHDVRPYVENCLLTLEAQTYPCGVYAVDDGSTDETRSFVRDRPHLWAGLNWSDERIGWTETLNRCAELAAYDDCDALFVMAADDWLRLDCIEKAVQMLRLRDWVVVNGQQIGGENVVQASMEGARLADFASWSPVTNYALIWTEVWNAVGGYVDNGLSDSHGFLEDWDFAVRLMKAGFTSYGVVREPAYYFRMRPGQLSEESDGRIDEYRTALHERHPELRS